MLQDYNESLNVYKSASKSYLTDKAWKYYASSQEMAGLCTFMLDSSKRDLDSYFDNAYMFYVRGIHYMCDRLT